jgi:sigma-B regulation protein RsbU (phosphoserine phosphatase)
MRSPDHATAILNRLSPPRAYGSSSLLAARHFSFVPAGTMTLDLADAMRKEDDVEVVAVLGPDRRPLGMISREKLFALLGKPFGREVLGRTSVAELLEDAPRVNLHESLFAVAGEALAAGRETPYLVLVDDEGAFGGILSARDLSEYLSRMTQDDIELAGEIQSRLAECNELVGDHRMSFEAWSRAAKGVGGDFWFTHRLDDGRVFLALCDVSGKGVAASLVVSMVWGMLLMFDYKAGLESLLVRLNESIIATFRLERYLTGFFAFYDPGTMELSVADMGHSHSLLARGGKVLRLKGSRRNMPLGIERVVEPAIERWRLREGDSLFVYSDGLVEQEDAQGLEYGEAALASALAGCLSRGEPLARSLPAAFDLHRGRIPQQDDMSFLCLSLRPCAPLPRREGGIPADVL